MSDGERQRLFLSASSVYTFCHIAPCLPPSADVPLNCAVPAGPQKKSRQYPSVATVLARGGASNSFKARGRPLTSPENTSVWCATGRAEEVRYRGEFFFNFIYLFVFLRAKVHQGLDFPRWALTCACRRVPIKAGESTTKQQVFSHPKDRLWHLWEGQS